MHLLALSHFLATPEFRKGIRNETRYSKREQATVFGVLRCDGSGFGSTILRPGRELNLQKKAAEFRIYFCGRPRLG
jgi:hypothetical protein